MQPWVATLLCGGVVVLVHIISTAFLYGQLTRDVKSNSDAVKLLGTRQTNVETVLMGPGGHGERLAALEAWRIEHRAKGAAQ
jgi:hypothetical protein